MVSHKEMNNSQYVPSECPAASICDGKINFGGVVAGKSGFILSYKGPVFPGSFLQNYTKKYLGVETKATEPHLVH